MDFVALVHQCAPWASPQTMAAIVRTESDFKPFIIGINGGFKLTRQPASKEEAAATAKWLINRGFSIDMGLGQINSANLTKLGLSVEDTFDPCKNIAASATILGWNYQSAKRTIANDQQALLAAISAYNTGNMRAGFHNGYVGNVVANARKGTVSTVSASRSISSKSASSVFPQNAAVNPQNSQKDDMEVYE